MCYFLLSCLSITTPQNAHKRLVLQIVEWLIDLLAGLARHELTLYITSSTGFNTLNPIVHFWLHHTAHYAGSALAERVGQGEVGGVTGRVLCTWWLLGLALKRPWLAPGGPPPALTAWTGLENTTLTLQRASFWQERLLGLRAGVWQLIVLSITFSLMSGCGESHEIAFKARSGHGCSFGVRAWTEMETRCGKGMCGLKVA